MNIPGVLRTSSEGVDTEASQDDGRQERESSHAADRERRRETDNELDTTRPSHNYKQHGSVSCEETHRQ